MTFDSASGRLAFTQYQVSADFLTGSADTTLRLTDFDADGMPDVWAVSAGGAVTAYKISGLSLHGIAKIKAKATQSLL